MTTKGCPTGQHTHHNTRAHAIAATPTLLTPNLTIPNPYNWNCKTMVQKNTGSRASLFCDTGGGGGDEILEEAGTFSGQALLLSYLYPRGGGGSSQGGRHPLTALSIVPTHLWYIQLRGGIDISL